MRNRKQSCPACGTGPIWEMISLQVDTGSCRFQSKVLECKACGHRFLEMTDSVVAQIEQTYDESYAGFQTDPYFAERIREALRLDIESKVAPPARVLDVGCGNGAFMDAAREYGYIVEGVDMSESGVSYCKERGLKARVGNFLEMDFNGPYDLITMWDVVEHLGHPFHFIKRARSLLSDGGVLLLKIPGFERATFYPIQVWNRLVLLVPGAPSHVQYFTHNSLGALLDRSGFWDIDWMRSRSFRSRSDTSNIKKKIGRAYIDLLNWMSGNENLYLTTKKRKQE